MVSPAPLTSFSCTPDPDNPGWMRWMLSDPERFNEAVLGKQIARAESDTTARLRMFPRPVHGNSGGRVHGAVVMALADVSLFSAMYLLRGTDAGKSMTIDLSTQFIGAGDLDRPLDAVVELLRETGRLGFLRGLIVQGNDTVAAYSGTVRKPTKS